MRVLEDIYNILSTDAGVTGLVGNDIFPVIVPEGHSLPAVVFTVLEQTPNNTKDQDSEIDEFVVEVYSIATDVLSSININEAVRTAMDYQVDRGGISKIFYREGISHAFDFIDPDDASAIAYSFIARYKIFYNR